MHRLLSAGLLLATTTIIAAPAPALIQLKTVLADHWAWSLEQSPTFATSLGVRTYDAKLGSLSASSIDAYDAKQKTFIKRLEAINPKNLTVADALNRDILLIDLRTSVAGNVFGQKYMLFTNRGGWHLSFAGLPDDVPFFNAADYESYLARLADYPRLNDEGIATTKLALKGGFTQYCDSMKGFEQGIVTHIVKNASDSVFMKPFERKPAPISDADFAKLRDRASVLVMTKIVPAYAAFRDFYVQDYAPKCRKEPGISSQPNGAAYYDFRIREQTTTTKTADEIHTLGLSEVARIRAEMEQVVKRANFNGDRKAFVQYLRSDPKFYAKTPEELLQRTSALMKQIDGEMPKLFGTLPRLPYSVKPIPADQAEGTTTAYYEPGAAPSGKAGVYRVNTSKLDQRPLFELPALSLHEAVPGHHNQIALQQELELPNFRRHLTFFTAYVEGWGLYSERLGLEMGLYDMPEKDFGRLSYEMWRACRLVVDTGIHAKGWSRQQAIDFMADNTALSIANITAEVDRYISWPGQALAYKIGELKIRDLRAKSEKALGAKFDLRTFHDAVLISGAVPLDVLEANIDRWIEIQRAK
jgi:uncharacterized protein (DUF885 family)